MELKQFIEKELYPGRLLQTQSDFWMVKIGYDGIRGGELQLKKNDYVIVIKSWIEEYDSHKDLFVQVLYKNAILWDGPFYGTFFLSRFVLCPELKTPTIK